MDIIDYTGLFKIFHRTSFNYEIKPTYSHR